MMTRRLFWLGAAVLLSAAAVVAIAAVLTGEFGETQRRILGTVGLLFGCGSTALAGRACIERRVVVQPAYAAIALACISFAYWTVGIWTGGYESDTLGKIAAILGAWLIALLIVTTLRLLLRAERLRPVFAGTVLTALLAACLGTVVIAADTSTGWQPLLVLVILTVAGYFLVPILQRFTAADTRERPHERVLGVVADAEVVAMRGPRAVRLGSETFSLDEDETIVVRRRS